MNYGLDTPEIDYLQGQIAAAQAEAQDAVTQATTLPTSGGAGQVVGFDAAGQPAPIGVQGDSNGAGLSVSGGNLVATLPQNLQTTGNPNFNSLNVTDKPATRSNLGAAAKASPAITGATIPLAKITGGGADGSLTVNAEGVITAYVAPT